MEQENAKNTGKAAAIEALLFVYGEPLEAKKAAKILGLKTADFDFALAELEGLLKNENSGLVLLKHGDKIQLATKPELSGLIAEFVKSDYDENLTPAALETLSLVAYFGATTRAKIDYYRGVNSSFTLRNLLMRGLIEKIPNPENAHANLYQITFDLLKYLGVSRVEELPDFEKFKGLAGKPEAAAEETNLADKKIS